MQRGASHHVIDRVVSVGRELVGGRLRVERGRDTLPATRTDVEQVLTESRLRLQFARNSDHHGSTTRLFVPKPVN